MFFLAVFPLEFLCVALSTCLFVVYLTCSATAALSLPPSPTLGVFVPVHTQASILVPGVLVVLKC